MARLALLQLRYMRRVTLLLSAALGAVVAAVRVDRDPDRVGPGARRLGHHRRHRQRPRPRSEPVRRLRPGPRRRRTTARSSTTTSAAPSRDDPWPNQRLDVRLLALDNVPNLKVVAPAGGLVVTGVGGSWGSVYAAEGSARTRSSCGVRPSRPTATPTPPASRSSAPSRPGRRVHTGRWRRPEHSGSEHARRLSARRFGGALPRHRRILGHLRRQPRRQQRARRAVPPRRPAAGSPRQLGCRAERDAGAQGPGRRGALVRPLPDPQLPGRALRRRRSTRPRATRRRARSTAAPPDGRAARRRTSRCWRTRSPTRRSRRPPARSG